jgi:hypothetical protein
VGIFLGLLSLALSVKAMLVPGDKLRVLLWLGAVCSGWGYLSQMEYYIGFELVRVALIALLVFREKKDFHQGIKDVFMKSLPYLSIPVLFLVWRFLIFPNERSTTDLGLQLGKFSGSPLFTGVWWVVYLLQDYFNVLFIAWTAPLYQFGFAEDLSLIIKVICLAFAVLLLIVVEFLFREDHTGESGDSPPDWQAEALALGSLWIVAGLLPVILVNRHITFFPDYSRYGLVSSAGGALTLVALLNRVSIKPLRWLLVGFLFLSAVMTHLANGRMYARAFSDIQSFWWQVSWRIPDLEKGTTIVAHYPNGGIRENSFVWGPANQVYYAENIGRNGTAITNVSALLLDDETVIKILTRQPQFLDPYRGVEAYPNPRNILIITQPGPRSCVQIIDGGAPEYSRQENDAIMLIGPYSETRHIVLGASFRTPPDYLFGAEPAHGWCYFYEKASLARQQGDWDEVLGIGNEAFARGLAPADPIEWMPFLQAYAISGDVTGLKNAAPSVEAVPFIARQACGILGAMQGLSQPVRDAVNSLYCVEGGG